MVRKLKFHEQKLLKKVDFISWEVDNNLHEVKILKRYRIQKREDYTKYYSYYICFFTVPSEFEDSLGTTNSRDRLGKQPTKLKNWIPKTPSV